MSYNVPYRSALEQGQEVVTRLWIVDEQVATLSRGATCTDAQPSTLPDFLLVQGAVMGTSGVVKRMTVDQVFAVAKNATKSDDVWVIRACIVK
ncbi:MAG: hypothetical protein KBF43_16770 [Dermatophilaceae bacterium]|nr:hypothetical protein [Dermatophilaceae bacterium]